MTIEENSYFDFVNQQTILSSISGILLRIKLIFDTSIVPLSKIQIVPFIFCPSLLETAVLHFVSC